jgi:hypothetical protein
VKDERGYLQHIQDALNNIASYCGSDREGFFADHMRHGNRSPACVTRLFTITLM